MRFSNSVLLAGALLLATPAVAQTAACTAVAPPPAELSGWATPATAMAAGTSAADAPTLTAGRAVPLSLGKTAELRFAPAPEKPGDAAGFGGVAQFTVAEAGTWRLALGTAAWIDVVAEGKALPSTAHAHGAPCTGIRKMVDFELSPGRYILQIAGNATAETMAMLTRLP